MTATVLDASVIVDALTVGRGLDLFERETNAPAHVRLEVASALRSLQRRRILAREEADRVFEDLCSLPLRTWDIDMLLPTTWGLRDDISAYDGLYVALAMHLDLPLVTLDRRLRAGASRYCRLLEDW